MKIIKTQSGITLIALIITIVVLLILAGVAIGTLQESNIIGRAKDAASSYEKEKLNENELITSTEDLLNKYVLEINGQKQEEPVWAEIQIDGMYAWCYIGNEKNVKITSDKIKVQEAEVQIDEEREEVSFSKVEGKIREANISDNTLFLIDFLTEIESIDFGNYLSNSAHILANRNNIKRIEGLEGITTFYEDCFAFETSLEHINFPSTLTTIETCAFQNTSLTKITIPASVTGIANSAFRGCTALTEVTIKKTKAEVEAEGGIGTAWIPDSVTKIIYSDQTVELN